MKTARQIKKQRDHRRWLLTSAACIDLAMIVTAAMAADLKDVRHNRDGDDLRIVFDLSAPAQTNLAANQEGQSVLSMVIENFATDPERLRLPEEYIEAMQSQPADSGTTRLSVTLRDNVAIRDQFEIPAGNVNKNHRVVYDLRLMPPDKNIERLAPASDKTPSPQQPAGQLSLAQLTELRDYEEKREEAQRTLNDKNGRNLPKALGVSNDDVRPDNQFQTKLFGRPLIVGGELEAAGRSQSNFNLDGGARDYRLRAFPEAKLELTYLPGDKLYAFVQAKAFLESELADADGSNESQAGLSLNQAWLFTPNIFGTNFSLQLGRQQFQDRREWWWDDELEAVRLHYSSERLSGFIAAAEKLWSGDTLEPLKPEERDLFRIMGNANYLLARRKRIDLFFLKQNDHSPAYAIGQIIRDGEEDGRDSDLTWVGARYRGRHKVDTLGKFYLNADIAYLFGDQTRYAFSSSGDDMLIVNNQIDEKIRAWGIDTSISWEVPIELEPYISFGFARGSGDRNLSGGRSTDFQQTGLQGNNGKFRGISRFRLYGETLRPALSNLQILTASLGVPIGENIWAETIFHDYTQIAARDEIASARLKRDPTGLDRNVGQEIDFILSFEYDRRWEFEFSAGAFRAGQAFGEAKGEWAHSAAFKLNYNF